MAQKVSHRLQFEYHMHRLYELVQLMAILCLGRLDSTEVRQVEPSLLKEGQQLAQWLPPHTPLAGNQQ